ncbi:F-box protein At5g07610-like [Hibiscus syriacus]|uniref:F-box protein At5g07610-like n=1 Tax=Hibiscus syriacus TaxID=106335 RepID=UPI0019238E1D|nr:F-box protein At5g07610-like [Hibiscus syriacus]
MRDCPLKDRELAQSERSVLMSQRDRGRGRERNQIESSTQQEMRSTARIYNLNDNEDCYPANPSSSSSVSPNNGSFSFQTLSCLSHTRHQHRDDDRFLEPTALLLKVQYICRLNSITQLLLRLPANPSSSSSVSPNNGSFSFQTLSCLSHTRHQHRDDDRFLEPTALLLKVQYILSPEFDVVPLKHYSKVPFFDYISSSNFDLIQSCNGLFLLESLDDDEDDPVSGYFICNPTTKKFKKLSFPRNPFKACDFYVSLAFDPLKYPHYKIIVVREVSVNSYEFEMDIYASETNCWKVSEFNFKAAADDGIAFRDAVFCNGKLHWNSYGNESLYFNDEKGSFQMMQMPTPSSDHHQLEIHRYFGEINGNLHLAVTYHAYIALDLNVHQMSSDYSHWFLKHRLNLGDATKVFPELNLGCYPFAPGFSGVSFVGSKKKNEAKVVIWADGKIICYDFGDVAWKMVYDPGPGLKFGAHRDHFNHLHEQRFISYKYFENLSCI